MTDSVRSTCLPRRRWTRTRHVMPSLQRDAADLLDQLLGEREDSAETEEVSGAARSPETGSEKADLPRELR